MTVVIAGGVVLAVLIGVTLVAHRVIRKVLKALNPAWLWFTGLPVGDGVSRTNATWTMPSRGPRPVLHASGHAVAWHHLPRLHRAGIRTGASIAFLAVVYGLWAARTLTLAVLVATVACLLLAAIWHVFYRVRNWQTERHYVKPLERTLVAKLPAAPVSLEVERNGDVVKRVAIEWAPEAEIGEPEKQLALEAVTARLALEAPEVSWETKGRARSVVFTPSQPPPGRVSFDEMRPLIEAAKPHEVVVGRGRKNELVKISVDNDSPHIGLSMGSGDGKALALDTRVPTPFGWTTMGEIKAGDLVYDETGAPCKVTDAWPVRYGRPCYEVEFSDGTVIVADGEHQWLTETLACRRTIRTDRPAPVNPRSRPEVVTTEAMSRTLRHGKHNNYSVQVAAALQCPDADLPVSPYTLGAWLGDGSTADSSVTSADPEIIAEIEAEGWATRIVPSTIKERHARYCVRGLRPRLRDIGVLGDKHIPVAYLRASESERRALLAGLLDTDGSCAASGVIEFYSTRERLARDVRHLAATLGYKVTIRSRTARLNGKDCGTVWIVVFTTADKVFRLPRKLARQVTTTRLTSARRYVTGVRPVSSVPVRCIAVNSPSHLYLVGETCIPTHNSTIAKNFAAQLAWHGALLVILDYKLISHMWARGLPNVAYAGTPAEIHQMLMWLAGSDWDGTGRESEIERRNRVALAGADIDGEVHADVGPRIFIIAEELNATQNRLAAYWRNELWEKGMPKRSPASEALDEILFLGRQVHVNVLQIGQRLSVKATSGGGGGGDSRENLGVKVFCDPSAATWRMLCEGLPQPPPAGHLGRIQVVTKKTVREVQGAYVTGQQARDFAIAGTVAVPRHDMPLIDPGRVLVPAGAHEALPQGPDQPFVQGQSPLVPLIRPGVVTLSEAVAAGVFGDRSLAAVRKALQRADDPPRPVGTRGAAHEYDINDLYVLARR